MSCPYCEAEENQEWSDGFPETPETPQEPPGWECRQCDHWYTDKERAE